MNKSIVFIESVRAIYGIVMFDTFISLNTYELFRLFYKIYSGFRIYAYILKDCHEEAGFGRFQMVFSTLMMFWSYHTPLYIRKHVETINKESFGASFLVSIYVPFLLVNEEMLRFRAYIAKLIEYRYCKK